MNNKHYSIGKNVNYFWPIIVLFTLQLFFIYPIIFQLFCKQIIESLHFFASSPFWRTLMYSLLTSATTVLFAFIGSIILFKLKCKILKKIMPITLFPVLLGNVTISYIILRSSWFTSLIENRSYWPTLATISLIDIWQYGLLFLYLFWFQFNFIKKQKVNYSKLYKFTLNEKVKLLYWPHSKNLAILLFIIGFIICFNESSKTSIILRASEATETEFISHSLSKIYQIKQHINHEHAINKVLSVSALIIFPTLVILCTYILFIRRASTVIFQSRIIKYFWKFIEIIPNWVYFFLFASVVVISVVPFIVILRDVWPLNIEPWKIVLKSASLIFIPALITTSFAIISGIYLRLALPKKLSGFNNSSVNIFISLFVFRIIPSIALSFCAISIFHSFFKGSNFFVYPFWIISQLILVIPFLLAFVLFIHFDLSYKEINFYSLSKVKTKEIISIHFKKKYLASYILVLIFSISFIWNEDSVTSMLSIHIPTANIELLSKSIGRGTDYSIASNLVIPNLIITGVIILIWTKISNKIMNKTHF